MTSERPKSRRSGCWIALIILGLLFVGALVMTILVFGFIGNAFKPETIAVKDHSVLHLKVAGTIEEYQSPDPVAAIRGEGEPVSTFHVLSGIRRAATDDRIDGIYFKSTDLRADISKASEIRDELKRFKKTGKFIYTFIEIGDEYDYYLASLADSIFMAPEGILEMNGFASAALFFKGTYDKLGIEFYVEQFEEYKSAGETYNRQTFSEPARRSIKTILDQRYEQFTNDIAADRGLSQARVKHHLREGLYRPDRLLEAGFIDAQAPEAEVREMVRAHTGTEELHLVSLTGYLKTRPRSAQKNVVQDKEIALIRASGVMMSGQSGPFDSRIIASDTFIKSLKKARDYDRVKAIILRVDTPGGAVLAADQIWHEIAKTAREKPVLMSMSHVAASGGYYMATACDTVIAYPTTITGSIGVVSVLPNFSKMLDKIGASADTITTTPSATFLYPVFPYSRADKEKFRELSRVTYHRFVKKVADSRNMTFEEARSLAKGRPWSGQDAWRLGLVDSLGGLYTSIGIAKEKIGVADSQKVRIRMLPEHEDPFTSLMRLFRSVTLRVQGKTGSMDLQWLSKVFPFWDRLPESIRQHIRYQSRVYRMALTYPIVMANPYWSSF
jgi:protease-4